MTDAGTGTSAGTAAGASAETIPAVRVAGVSKIFPARGRGAGVTALEDIDLRVEPGQFVSLIGPSGCGKSTLLRLIADLDRPSAGTVEVLGLPAPTARRKQSYGIAFQQAGLLPWRTVAANIRLPLELHGVPASGRQARVDELLAMVGLSDFADRYPDQLSGGMQQRVAIARSLAESPGLLLMDEPFGALDEMTRERMQSELARIRRETSAAVVFVTHSIPEAVFLSDKVVVMSPRPGRIVAELPIELDRGADGDDVREGESFFRQVSAVRELLHGDAGTSGARGVDVR